MCALLRPPPHVCDIRWNFSFSIKDTLNRGHLSKKDTQKTGHLYIRDTGCCPNYTELCNNILEIGIPLCEDRHVGPNSVHYRQLAQLYTSNPSNHFLSLTHILTY